MNNTQSSVIEPIVTKREKATTNIEQDILATCEIEKHQTLDQVEDKLEILEGTLEFAIANADNKGFYLGLQDHIKAISNLLNKLRN